MLGTISKMTIIVGAAAGLCSAALAADDYPNKTVRFIVPLAAGGGTDTVARVVAGGLSDILGQPVVVENHPGGSSMIGTQVVVSSPADGYTLLLGAPTMTVNPSLRPDELPYDTFTDLAPVSLLSVMPYVIVVSPQLGVSTLEELLDLARERPGELTAGTPGIASGGHLALELFQDAADVELLHVPYTGTSPATLDLIGGRIDMQFATAVPIQPHIQSGAVIPIAVTTEMRSDSLPDVPAVSELIEGFETATWSAIMVRTGTPDSIIEKLNAAANEVVYSDTVSEVLEREGAMPSAGTPEELWEFVLSEAERFSVIIERAGITAE